MYEKCVTCIILRNQFYERPTVQTNLLYQQLFFSFKNMHQVVELLIFQAEPYFYKNDTKIRKETLLCKRSAKGVHFPEFDNVNFTFATRQRETLEKNIIL